MDTDMELLYAINDSLSAIAYEHGIFDDTTDPDVMDERLNDASHAAYRALTGEVI